MITWATLPWGRVLKWTTNYHRKSFHLLSRRYSQNTMGLSFAPHDGLVSSRREEAQRSLLVEVAGLDSVSDLHQVCSQYGNVHKMFHYTLKSPHNNKEMILVEFEESSSLKQALNFTCINSAQNVIPAHSPFVWLAANKASDQASSVPTREDMTDIITPNITYSAEKLVQEIVHCSNMSEQIQKLYDCQKLTELGWRLRFFTCRQIEVALSGLFPNATVLPFGSSINSFGNLNCDLDMILELSSLSSQDNTQRLVFQAKKSLSSVNSRLSLQRQMELISDILDNFVPGCSQVRRILNARVPIIKYHQDLTDVECDLSMSNRSGFYMSQMLYMYGSMDPRVRPLVFAVRRWAKDRHITSQFSGRWVTNFSLTIMVLFYLMNVSPPVIASLQSLEVNTGPCDGNGENVRFTFPQNIEKMATTENDDSLETLFRRFFEFYDKFNFRERGLSIMHGKSFAKPEHSALYIQNPLDHNLNISRNVTLEEVDRLRVELTHARFRLEGSTDSIDVESNSQWGALCLWDVAATGNLHSHQNSQNYSIDWKDMFHAEDRKIASSTNSNNVSTKFDSKNNKKRINNSNPNFSEKDNALRGGMRVTSAPELNGLISKLKQKAGQKGHIPRRNKFVYKGKFK
ncbi:poly(A) RNA polymerase, mitochondrial isoform X1 [Procambarus clarkii]|uniref:poly(A) RNA polymerase, mitochondrial isoform X1 n=1 Tax=Procambarus clarkii TaxID=6728 RepID=UPI00374363AB